MRPPKKLPPLTKERLDRSALAYIERYATSKENLRRVLRRKLIRADSEQRPALAAHIDMLIEKFEAQGYLNDQVYADGRIASLRRQGRSARAIQQKLQAKGVGRDLAADRLAEDESSDGAAAVEFARRKRLGPYRAPELRRDFREKDMAAMGRAGFDYGTARSVIDAALIDGEIAL